MNCFGQLFHDNGNIKTWKDLKIEFHLKNPPKIYWLQIIDTLPKTWKDIILKGKGNTKHSAIFDHHIVRNSQICSLNKLTSKELIFVDANRLKPTAQDSFENLFETFQFKWKKINFLVRSTTLDTKALMFQYKVLDNILYYLYYINSILSNLYLPITTPQSAIFGFWDSDKNEHLIINHLFKYFKNVHLQCKNNRLLECK